MTTPPRPPDADDGRDARLGGLLEVPPLDEVTRARLVRTALAGADEPASEQPGARRPLARMLAVAAALLVVLVVGLAVVVPRGSDDPAPTALDAPTDAKRATPDAPFTIGTGGDPALREAPSAAESGSLDATVPTSLTLPSVGDLGDVSSETRLARAATARLAQPLDTATVTVEGCAVDAGRAFGAPVAAGSGTIDGRRAVVIVAEQPSGATAVVAVRGRSCARAVSAILP